MSCPQSQAIDPATGSCAPCNVLITNCNGGCTSATNCLGCASGYYVDATGVCSLCHYTCLTCTGAGASACGSCPANSFRTLSTTTSACDPSTGYYDNGVATAVACVSPCSACTSASACTACVTGYSLSGTSCSEGDDSTNVGLIVGVTIGAVVLILIIVLIIWLICRDKEESSTDSKAEPLASNG